MSYSKTVSISVLSILFLFLSCNSDDDGNNGTNNQSSIIGTWKYTSSTFNGVNDELTTCDLLSTLMFSETQLVSTDYYGDNCEMTETFTEDYSVSGNIVSITFEGNTYSAEIVTLNSTTLSIKETEDGDEYVDTYTRQ